MSGILPGDPREFPPSWLLDVWDNVAQGEAWKASVAARRAGKSLLEAEAIGQQAHHDCWHALKAARERCIEKESGA
jgi:hypothetical protein